MRQDEVKERIKSRLGEYLTLREECAGMRERIQNKQEEIDWLKSLMENNNARLSEDIRSQAAQAAELIERMVRYYTHLVQKRENTERQIVDMLEKVENNSGRQILYLHYIEGMDFNDIPFELQMSLRGMWYKYEAAIDELYRLEKEKPEDFAQKEVSPKDFMLSG